MDDIQNLLSAALSHQVTQFTVAFTIAAWLHAGRVKKEIASQMQAVVASIDSVANALKAEVIAQNARITVIENEVTLIKQTMTAEKK